MRKILLLILVFSLNAFAQNQPGYYITKDKKTVKGYFKTADFTNPEFLQFSSTEDGEYTKLPIDRITEYGVDGQYKLIKSTVKIDKSTTNYTTARSNIDSNWKEETVFLNVILEGKASLYSYDSEWGTKYFYSLNDNQPLQLVYRVYKNTDGKKGEINDYKNQLFTNLKCDGQTVSDFLSVRYTKDNLIGVVQNYNKCNNVESVSFENKSGNSVVLKYNIFAGVQSSSFSLESSEIAADKGNAVNFSVGGEGTLLMASRKYEFFLRLEYERLSVESVSTVRIGSYRRDSKGKVDGNMFNILVGPRINFITTENHTFFGDIAAGISSGSGDIRETIHFTTNGGTIGNDIVTLHKIGSTFTANIGVGYMFRSKYGAALRYELPRNFDSDFEASYKAKVGRIGLNLIYRIN